MSILWISLGVLVLITIIVMVVLLSHNNKSSTAGPRRHTGEELSKMAAKGVNMTDEEMMIVAQEKYGVKGFLFMGDKK